MEYQVPQFLEVEDKVFGPLSLKQFIYVAGGAGICAVLVMYVPKPFGFILAIPFAALTLALAFYKVNNKTFIEVLEAGFNYYFGSRLYLWKRVEKQAPSAAPKPPTPAIETRQKLGLSQNKLHELAWSLDIKDQNLSS